MVLVAQLVRAPGCGSGGREFNSPQAPQIMMIPEWGHFNFLGYYYKITNRELQLFLRLGCLIYLPDLRIHG